MISGTLHGRADDRAYIYADGVFLMTIRDPFTTSTATLPNNTRLLAVNATSFSGTEYGFVLKLSNGFVTDTLWRCGNIYNDDWYKLSFNDDEWQPAIIVTWTSWWAPQDLFPAEIIWAKTYADVVYCRGWPSKYNRPNST